MIAWSVPHKKRKYSPSCWAACGSCRKSRHRWPAWGAEGAAPSQRSWSRPYSPCWWLSQTHRSPRGHQWSGSRCHEDFAGYSSLTWAWGPLWWTPANRVARPCQLVEGWPAACSYSNNGEDKMLRKKIFGHAHMFYFPSYCFCKMNIIF